MPTIIDEIGVVAEIETAPLFRGLEIADDAIERFRAQSRVAVVLDAKLETTGLAQQLEALLPDTRPTLEIPVRITGADEAKAQVRQLTDGISPAAFEAFSQAATQSFSEIAQALGGLNATLEQITGGVAGFFQGAAEELQRLAVTSGTAAQSQADLAQRSLQAAEGFRAAGIGGAQLNAELERTGFLSEQTAQATLRLAEARRQAALAAGAGAAAAALTVPTGFDKFITDQQRAAAGSRELAAGFALASRQANTLAEATAAAATGNGRVAAGFALAAEQARAAAAAEGTLAISTGRAAGALTLSSIGGSRLLNTLSGIAVGAAGAGGKVGSLASNLLTFASTAALGGVAGVAVVGVAAAIGLAYEALTGKTREAREELEKFIDAQVRAGNLRADPASELRDKLREANAELGHTEEKIADLTSTRNKLLTALSGGLDPQAIIQVNGALGGTAKQLEEARNRAADLRDTIHETEAQIGEKFELSAGQSLISQLGQQAAALQIGERAVERLAIAMNTKLTPAERDGALALFDQITALQRLQQGMENLQKVLGTFGPPTDINPQDQVTHEFKLKPVIDNTELLAAMQRVVEAAKQARLDDSIQAELDRAAKAADDLFLVLQQVDLSLKDIGNANITGPAASAAQLSEALLTAGRGINDIAHAFDFATQRLGIFGQEGSRVLQSLGNLAEDVTGLLASIASGNPFGVAVGALNALGDLGGIFGGGESEHDRVVRENTQALRENTARQSDAFRGAGGQLDLAQRVEGALDRFRAATEARNEAIENLVRSGATRDVAALQVGDAPSLTATLRGVGLSLEDLQRVADEVAPGLQLVDKNGHLVADALEQLNQAVEESIKAQFRFSSSFDDQLRRTSLESRLLLGRDQSPSEKFNQEVLAAGASGASVIRDAFKGINLSDGVDPAEAEKVRAALQGLLLAFENGTLDLSKLGSLSPEDFLKLVEDGADFLDTFNQAVKDATLSQVQSTEALRQKLFGTGSFDAAAEFQSQVAGLAQLAPDFAKQFESLGTFGPEDQAAVRAILQQGFQNLIAGVIPEGLTADEFQQFLEQGAGFLNSFNLEVSDATKRLTDLNIPEGFRRAALAFQTGDRGPDLGAPSAPARTDEGGQVGPLGPDLLEAVKQLGRSTDGAAQPDFDALVVSMRPVGDALPRLTDVLDSQDDVLRKLVDLLDGRAEVATGGRETTDQARSVVLQIAAGAIVVNAAPGQSPRDVATSVLDQFRQLAMAQTGDTLQLGSFT